LTSPAASNDEGDEALPPPQRLLDLPPTDPLRFAVDGLFIERDVNGIVGDGDAGKSTLLLAVSAAVAIGAPALGGLDTIGGPVLYVSGEDNAAVIKNRLEAIAAGHRWDRAAVLRNVHVYDEGVDLDAKKWQDRLIEAARDLGAVFAVFDPLGDLCGDGVNENNNSDAKRVTRYLRRFMRESGATPALSMHVAKPSEDRSERKWRVRGASAWRNATRLCWWVEGMEGGFELDPIKKNRLASSASLRVKRTVASEDGNRLMWRAAHIALDTGNEVASEDAIRLLRWLADKEEPLSRRMIEDGDHGIPKNRAGTALVTARGRRWAEYEEGPRGAHLYRITEAGRARVMLEGR
jgi:hypothetical protein